MTETEIILLFCSFSLWFAVFFVVINTVHIMRQRRRIRAAIKPRNSDHAQYMALLAGSVAAARRTPPPLPTNDLPRFLK